MFCKWRLTGQWSSCVWAKGTCNMCVLCLLPPVHIQYLWCPCWLRIPGIPAAGAQWDSTWIQVKSVTSTAEYRGSDSPQRPGFSFEPGHSTSAERTQCYSKKGKWSENLSFLLVLLPCTSQPLKIMTGGKEKTKQLLIPSLSAFPFPPVSQR